MDMTLPSKGYIFFVFIFIFSCTVSSKKTSNKVIKIAIDSHPRSYDPRSAVDANSQYIEDLVHCSLFSFQSDGSLINDLVASWKWLSPLQLDLTLKKGIKYSDGL